MAIRAFDSRCDVYEADPPMVCGSNLASLLLKRAYGTMQDMINFWCQGRNVTSLLGEVDALAATLEGRHGFHAAEIAEFFSSLHASRGNESRSNAWAAVAEAVRERMDERIQS